VIYTDDLPKEPNDHSLSTRKTTNKITLSSIPGAAAPEKIEDTKSNSITTPPVTQSTSTLSFLGQRLTAVETSSPRSKKDTCVHQ
jgi:hypothetical protein